MCRAVVYVSNFGGKGILQRRMPQQPAVGPLPLSSQGMSRPYAEIVRRVAAAITEQRGRPRIEVWDALCYRKKWSRSKGEA
jgi:hypothetical protein